MHESCSMMYTYCRFYDIFVRVCLSTRFGHFGAKKMLKSLTSMGGFWYKNGFSYSI